MTPVFRNLSCVFPFFFISLFHLPMSQAFCQVPEGKTAEEPSRMAFATYIGDPHQEYAAAMLVDSIRRWAGRYRNHPIYVVFTDPAISGMRLRGKNIEAIHLETSESMRTYPFAVKALAAAAVEEKIAGRISSLAWFDPETLLFLPPEEMDLPQGVKAAVNPVHLTNIGQSESEPIHPFWSAVYKKCGLETDRLFTVKTMIDQRRVRVWLNCGIFSVRPEMGLLRKWAQLLEEMIRDDTFQKECVVETGHRIFLHQAVLSSLIAARLKREEIHLFSRGNGYPVFCHNTDFKTAKGVFRVPPEIRAQRLNDLTSVFHESMWYGNSSWQEALPPADEPLKQWLREEYDRTIGSLQVAENLYREENSCNSYLVKTPRGSVLIDPAGASHPRSLLHRIALNSPVQAILLTHAHEDHRQGIAGWRGAAAIPVIGQREMVEFIRYHDRLGGFLDRRTAAQTGAPYSPVGFQERESPIETTLLYDDQYSYESGGMHFHFFHTGGETPDQSLLWVPELRAVFIGDNYYTSFPNLYTLRGTKPRWALDYIRALDKAISLEPEILLPGHGEPLLGKTQIHDKLVSYREAIRYVHDTVVRGMNEGKSVYALMQKIRLPEEYGVGEFYGRVSWSVRGIYEGYAGWFDENPSSLYELPMTAVYSDLVQLSGGTEALTQKAADYLQKGDPLRALHLTEIALSTNHDRRPTLEIRLQALQALRGKSTNYIETRWLDHFIRTIELQLR